MGQPCKCDQSISGGAMAFWGRCLRCSLTCSYSRSADSLRLDFAAECWSPCISFRNIGGCGSGQTQPCPKSGYMRNSLSCPAATAHRDFCLNFTPYLNIHIAHARAVLSSNPPLVQACLTACKFLFLKPTMRLCLQMGGGLRPPPPSHPLF